MTTYRFKGKKVTLEELTAALRQMPDGELLNFTEAIVAISVPLVTGVIGVLFAHYFAFLAFSALIFAQRAFTARIMFARPAADMVLLRPLPFALVLGPSDTALVLAPFRAAIAPRTAFNCPCNFDSSCFNASIISMKPPVAY